MLFFQKTNEYKDYNDKKIYSELNKKILEKIISNGQTNNNNEYYDYFFVDDKKYKISYFKKESQFSLYYESNMISYCYLYSYFVFCSNPVSNCQKYYYNLVKNYIK